MRNPFPTIRWAGFIEGLSYLALLFIAMPIKYLGGNEIPVKVVGSIHGGLFLIFWALAAYGWYRGKWSILPTIKVFASALIPFGWLWIERFLKNEAERVVS